MCLRHASNCRAASSYGGIAFLALGYFFDLLNRPPWPNPDQFRLSRSVTVSFAEVIFTYAPRHGRPILVTANFVAPHSQEWCERMVFPSFSLLSRTQTCLCGMLICRYLRVDRFAVNFRHNYTPH